MIIDAAHASEATLDDIFVTIPSLPFMVSHTGLQSICPGKVNSKDIHKNLTT